MADSPSFPEISATRQLSSHPITHCSEDAESTGTGAGCPWSPRDLGGTATILLDSHQHDDDLPHPDVFGDAYGALPPRASTTLIQMPPADPRVSRAALPPDYDTRAHKLTIRMAAAGLSYLLLVAVLATCLVAAVGARRLLVLLAAAEAAFAVYFRRKYNALNTAPERHAPDNHDPLKAFSRLLQITRVSSHAINAQDYLSSWFCGADPDTVRQDNLADLLAYGFWYKSRAEMEAEGKGPLLRRCVAELQTAFGMQLPPGYTPGLTSMTHLWEPLRAGYRPLVFYLGTEVLAGLCRVLLLALGCNLSSDPRAGGMLVVTYGIPKPPARKVNRRQAGKEVAEAVVAKGDGAAVGGGGGINGGGDGVAGAGHLANGRQYDSMEGASGGGGGGDGGVKGSGTAATEAQRRTAPVVFLHGVGLGLLPYLNYLRCLIAAHLPILAVEYKHVSLRLCSIIPSADDIAAAVVSLMGAHGIDQACVVAHSYGTFVASRIAQLHFNRLQSMALLDPVCFGMFLPSLLANFIYRKPRTTSLRIWLEDTLTSFMSRDLHCAATMCRRFYWSDLNLWPQDAPNRTLVAIAGKDDLIHVDAVMEFVRHYAAKVLFHPEHSHAQLLIDPAWTQQIVADVLSMASSGFGEEGAREVQRRLTTTTTTTTAPPLPSQPPLPSTAQEHPHEPKDVEPPLQPPTQVLMHRPPMHQALRDVGGTLRGGTGGGWPQVRRRLTEMEGRRLGSTSSLPPPSALARVMEDEASPSPPPDVMAAEAPPRLQQQHLGGGAASTMLPHRGTPRRWTVDTGEVVASPPSGGVAVTAAEPPPPPLQAPVPGPAGAKGHSAGDKEMEAVSEGDLAAIAADLRKHIALVRAEPVLVAGASPPTSLAVGGGGHGTTPQMCPLTDAVSSPVAKPYTPAASRSRGSEAGGSGGGRGGGCGGDGGGGVVETCVQRRRTGSPTLMIRNTGPWPNADEQWRMELAAAGLNHAVLIAGWDVPDEAEVSAAAAAAAADARSAASATAAKAKTAAAAAAVAPEPAGAMEEPAP